MARQRISTSCPASPLWIFCPTRDRPESLLKTLDALVLNSNGVPSFRVVVIDDSISPTNSHANQRIVASRAHFEVTYHGKLEQRIFLDKLKNFHDTDKMAMSCFIRDLGDRNWDLGAIRNYELCLWRGIAGPEAVIVMIDDDVEIKNPIEDRDAHNGSLETMFNKVSGNPMAIVGGHLEGMEDVSGVERTILETQKALGLRIFKLPHRPVGVSGGMMAFSQFWAERIPFSRTYNEDWIWLLGCKALGAKVIRSKAQGIHAWTPHKPILKERLIREQFGEVFCEGLSLAYRESNELSDAYAKMRKPSFWNEVLDNEIRYLNGVIKKFLKVTNHKSQKIGDKKQLNKSLDVLKQAFSIVNEISPDSLVRYWVEYKTSTNSWRKIQKQIGKVQ